MVIGTTKGTIVASNIGEAAERLVRLQPSHAWIDYNDRFTGEAGRIDVVYGPDATTDEIAVAVAAAALDAVRVDSDATEYGREA